MNYNNKSAFIRVYPRPFLLVLVLLASLAAPLAASAQTKTVNWKRYDVDITVQTNGDLRVIETQEIEFVGGPFRSGFAVIPLARSDGIDNITLSEPGRAYANASGGDFTYTVSQDSSNVDIDWNFPPLADETRTFELAYTVHGAIRQYDSGDKIQFLAITRELEFPIIQSTVTVHLPPGGALIADPQSSGAEMFWETSLDSLSVKYVSTSGIRAYEGVEIGLVFQHGAIQAAPPSWQAGYDRQAAFDENVKPLLQLGIAALVIALLLAVPGGLYLIWFLLGRDPAAGLVPEFISEPPSKLAPGLAGTLIDERADLRDLTATLIDFARRGLVTLEAHESAGAFGATSRSFLLKKNGEPDKLTPYEKMLYDAVFGGLAERDLGKLPDNFYSRLSSIESAMYTQAVSEGLFKSHPEQVRTNYQVIGAVLLVMSVAASCVTAVAIPGDISFSVACLFLPAMLFGIGLMALSRAMPAKTRKGAEEAAKWQAFQKYLGNIQKYKDIAGATDQFEKYLPYAVAFGLERRWVNAFAQAPNVVVPAPIWYRPILAGGLPLGRGPLVGGAPAAPGGQMPGLNQMGDGMVGGLNSMGEGLINALNTAGRSFSTSPATTTYRYSGGGSRGFSGGSFRSGGGFRGGGFSGGGSRGFR